MNSPHLMNRNEIAALLGKDVSVDVVRKNEERLGIRQFKVAINRRNILYKRAGVLQALEARGFIELGK